MKPGASDAFLPLLATFSISPSLTVPPPAHVGMHCSGRRPHEKLAEDPSIDKADELHGVQEAEDARLDHLTRPC